MHGDFLQSIHEPHVDDWVFGKALDGFGPRSVTLHGSFFDAEWNVDRLFSHWQASTHRENQHPEGVCRSLHANHAVTRVPYHVLHVHSPAAWWRPSMEPCCDAPFRNLQTTLVAKPHVHPQLVRLFQHVLNAHTSRRHRYRTLLDRAVFDSAAVEVAEEGDTIDNRIGGSVDNRSILGHIHTPTVKLCLLRYKVNQLKLVKVFEAEFCLQCEATFRDGGPNVYHAPSQIYRLCDGHWPWLCFTNV